MGKIAWYSHLFKRFPQFVMIHTVKGFSIVGETEVDIFLKLPSFLYDPVNHQKAREFKKIIYFCFIDYAKAFDCVDHNKLWKILQ